MEETKNTLRNYRNIKVLKNIGKPIMFLGFPLKIAKFYISFIILGFIIGLYLDAMKYNILIKVSIPLGIISLGSLGTRLFYKKFGVNGFELTQRDKSSIINIQGTTTVLDAIKTKIKKKNG